MSNAPVNHGRRRFLTIATSVVGGVGAIGAAVPFIASWSPSERARQAGAAVTADVSKMEEGQLIRVEWRGKPVWIVKRTQQMIDELPNHENRLRDPESKEEQQQPVYAQNRHRSIRPEFFVAIGICTHFGCSPTYLPSEFAEGIQSGFFCPCHGSRFDIAGRVFQNVPAPTNLVVPPYMFTDEFTILVGEDEETA